MNHPPRTCKARSARSTGAVAHPDRAKPATASRNRGSPRSDGPRNSQVPGADRGPGPFVPSAVCQAAESGFYPVPAGLRARRRPPHTAAIAHDEPSRRPRVSADPRTDAELMEAFRDRGDMAAFELIVRRYQGPLYNYFARSVGRPARAEELVQELFLRLVRSRERYERTAKLSTWLFTIARNLTVDEARRQRFRRHRSLDAPGRRADGGEGAALIGRIAAEQVPVDEAADGPRVREQVLAAVAALPDAQREVFTMRQFGGLSFREIADILGVSDNTVKSRMRYALEKLRDKLDHLRPAQEEAGDG